MVTYADLRRWDPAAIGAAGSDLRSDLATLERTTDTLQTRSVPDSFLGIGSSYATIRKNGLVSSMTTHLEEAGSFEKSVYTAQSDVTVLRRMVDSIDAEAAAKQFRIGGDGSVTDVSPPQEFVSIRAAEAHTDERVRLRDSLVERIESALTRAAKIDEDLLWSLPRHSFSDGADEVGDPDGKGDHVPLTGPVDLSDDAFDLSQIMQGGIGDCWFISAAGAVGANDPDFIRDHIRYNPDGSYTVTLYDDGEPVDVRVEASTITDGVTSPDGKPTWLSLYEKAAAAHLGGDYDDIDSDQVSRGLELVTGRGTEDDGDRGLDDIQDDLDDGRVLVVSTENATDSGLNPFDTKVDDDNVVPNHAYVIESVTERDGERIIKLVNPWGPEGGSLDGKFKDGVLELTEEEFHRNFDTTTSIAGS